jgi:hypothetical protein
MYEQNKRTYILQEGYTCDLNGRTMCVWHPCSSTLVHTATASMTALLTASCFGRRAFLWFALTASVCK